MSAAAAIALLLVTPRSFAQSSQLPQDAALPSRTAAAPPPSRAAAPAPSPAAVAPPADPSTPAAPAAPPAATAPPTDELTGESTLARWKQSPAEDRSRIAVALARNRLAADASKLDVAKMAMEITGCLSATAKDPRAQTWKVAATAATCMTAPEK
ncbi:MAG TPA: hypothetical protein VGK20_04400 [Candidatus Binatia bacterium]